MVNFLPSEHEKSMASREKSIALAEAGRERGSVFHEKAQSLAEEGWGSIESYYEHTHTMRDAPGAWIKRPAINERYRLVYLAEKTLFTLELQSNQGYWHPLLGEALSAILDSEEYNSLSRFNLLVVATPVEDNDYSCNLTFVDRNTGGGYKFLYISRGGDHTPILSYVKNEVLY